MLSCFIGKERFNLCESKEDKKTLKKWSNKNILICPACGKPYEYCHGKVISPYFRHKDKEECIDKYSESETEEHINGKMDLYNWIKNQNGVYDIVLEGWLKDTKQRPDIMFKYNNKQYVIEYQCTPISSEYYERHELYKASGIIDIWICGTLKYLQKYHKGSGTKRFNVLEKDSSIYYDVNKKTFILTNGGKFKIDESIIGLSKIETIDYDKITIIKDKTNFLETNIDNKDIIIDIDNFKINIKDCEKEKLQNFIRIYENNELLNKIKEVKNIKLNAIDKEYKFRHYILSISNNRFYYKGYLDEQRTMLYREIDTDSFYTFCNKLKYNYGWTVDKIPKEIEKERRDKKIKKWIYFFSKEINLKKYNLEFYFNDFDKKVSVLYKEKEIFSSKFFKEIIDFIRNYDILINKINDIEEIKKIEYKRISLYFQGDKVIIPKDIKFKFLKNIDFSIMASQDIEKFFTKELIDGRDTFLIPRRAYKNTGYNERFSKEIFLNSIKFSFKNILVNGGK